MRMWQGALDRPRMPGEDWNDFFRLRKNFL